MKEQSKIEIIYMVRYMKVKEYGKVFIALLCVFSVFTFHVAMLQAAAPTVVTGAAEDITKTSATLVGTITSDGGEIITANGFEFGTTVSYGQSIAGTDEYAIYDSKFGTTGSGNGQFANPYVVEFDSTGNIFVLELDNSRVQKFNSAGVYQSQFGSAGVGDGQFSQPRGMGIDSSDNIYVADLDRVQKFNSSGVYQSQLTGDFTNPYDVGFDESGNIYVVDTGEHEIDIFNSSGTQTSTVGSIGSGDGEFNSPMFIDFDSSGNFYVTDFSNHRVQKFNSAGVYQSQFGTSGTGNGQFEYIRGIAINSSDNIFVSDIQSHRVQKFNSAGVYQSQFGTFGTGDGQFNGPYGIAVDSLDSIYVPDALNNRIQKFTEIFSADLSAVLPSLTCGTTYHYRAYATNATATSYGADETFTTTACDELIVRTRATEGVTDTTVTLNGSHEAIGALTVSSRGFSYGLTASYGSSVTSSAGDLFTDTFGVAGAGGVDGEFIFPSGVGADLSGNVYVSDQFEDRIQKFDSAGNFLLDFGSTGSGVGQFSSVYSVRGSPDGRIFITDANNTRIQTFDTSGLNPAIFAPGASLTSPTDIAFDSNNNVYIADSFGNKILKYDSTGTTELLEITVGAGSVALSSPLSVGVDSQGNIYVSDGGSVSIQKFNSAGTYVDSVGGTGAGDGQFGGTPGYIAIDGDDYIYVTDGTNNRIQKFDSNLTYLSEFGTSGTGDAQFSNPYGITIGQNGDIFVVDQSNSRVQIFNEYFSSNLTGLTCGTTYHYRATATSDDGTDTGDDATFTTSVCPGGASGGGGSSGTHFLCIDPLALNYTNDLGFGKINNDICKYPKKDTPPNELSCTTPLYLTRPVKYGASNDPNDVKLLEKYLNTYEGYNLPVDGIYSKPDFDAVVKWQEKYFTEILKPWNLQKGTGYVFLTSLKKIKSIHEAECAKQGTAYLLDGCYLYDQKLKMGDKNNFVKFAQKALKASGSLSGSADGIFGAMTELAVKDFQKKNSLSSDGVIGYQTGKKLETVKCSI